MPAYVLETSSMWTRETTRTFLVKTNLTPQSQVTRTYRCLQYLKLEDDKSHHLLIVSCEPGTSHTLSVQGLTSPPGERAGGRVEVAP